MEIGRRGRNGPCWCSSRHRNPIGNRHCRSNAQVDPKSNGATASRQGCRRPAEPDRVVSRRDVARCLSCLHRKGARAVLGEGVLATAPPYPTGQRTGFGTVSTIKAAAMVAAGLAVAAGVASAAAPALTEGVLQAMLSTKLHKTLILMLMAGVLSGG